MADEPRYPRRDSHFAHKAVRAMVKTCVANEFGVEVFALLTIIAHTEDAAHYRRPVTFYNPALMPLIGISSETSFKRVRDRAVKSGWLVYVTGAKRRPAKYWVQIPTYAEGLDDNPTDDGDEFRPDSRPPEDRNADDIRTESGRNADDIVPPFNPDPNPDPDPEESLSAPEGPDDTASEDSGSAYQELLDMEREFVAAWNATEGNVKSATVMLTPKRRTSFRARLKDKPPWRWRDALARFPLPCLTGRKSWADLEWFLKPDSVQKILEGKYDWTPSGNSNGKPKPNHNDLDRFNAPGAGDF